ncbi:hypothetical protein KDH_43620 [Dictyobacter sp. S3.2.2.5]|uniref:Uncharacterized protein n=1 Tax=Dictyobacter halimunensis TaxID=3026934 RepID=A0ABQ6FVA7_9CHLR|nr:hypothetical protein KDH_43620 [Dictyobacter sp. S3.2.2.5]
MLYFFAILLVLGILFAFGSDRFRFLGIALLVGVALACAVVWIGHFTIS